MKNNMNNKQAIVSLLQDFFLYNYESGSVSEFLMHTRMCGNEDTECDLKQLFAEERQIDKGVHNREYILTTNVNCCQMSILYLIYRRNTRHN